MVLTIYDDPISKPRPRATIRGGRSVVYMPTSSKDAEWRIQDGFRKQFPEHEPWTGAVALQVFAHLRIPKSIPKKRRATAMPLTKPDVANLGALVADALEGCAYLDDKQVMVSACTKLYTEQSPRWVISVEEIKEDDLARISQA